MIATERIVCAALLLVAGCVGPSTGPETRQSGTVDGPDDVQAIYTAVLTYALARYPAREGVPNVLHVRASNRACAPQCADTVLVERDIDPRLLSLLRSRNVIQGECRGTGVERECSIERPRVVVNIGVPFRMRPGSVIPPILPYRSIAEASGSEVEAEVAVDVRLDGGCPRSGPGDCNFPDVVLDRYYLARGPGGAWRAIAWIRLGEV